VQGVGKHERKSETVIAGTIGEVSGNFTEGDGDARRAAGP
jgi:hypothetical protein